MSTTRTTPLAWTAKGVAIALPDAARYWKARRRRGAVGGAPLRGSPTVVQDPERGGPLLIPIECERAALEDEWLDPGRYSLIALDETGQELPGCAEAYVEIAESIGDAPRPAAPAAAAAVVEHARACGNCAKWEALALAAFNRLGDFAQAHVAAQSALMLAHAQNVDPARSVRLEKEALEGVVERAAANHPAPGASEDGGTAELQTLGKLLENPLVQGFVGPIGPAIGRKVARLLAEDEGRKAISSSSLVANADPTKGGRTP